MVDVAERDAGAGAELWPTPLNDWEPRHLSYSSVSKFVECPFAWYSQYVKGKKFKSNRGMVVGSVFGRAIEDAHNGKQPNVRQIHDALPTWDKRETKPEDVEKIERLYSLYAPDGAPPYEGTPEWKFSVYLPGCGPDGGPVPYKVMGYLDLKRPRAVSEFKTSAWVDHPEWGWSQKKIDESDQAAIYFYAFLLAEGFEPEEVRFHILDTKNISYRELVTYPTMERVLKFRDKAQALCEAIEAEAFGVCLCNKCTVPNRGN
jgi:hypothetical protein